MLGLRLGVGGELRRLEVVVIVESLDLCWCRFWVWIGRRVGENKVGLGFEFGWVESDVGGVGSWDELEVDVVGKICLNVWGGVFVWMLLKLIEGGLLGMFCLEIEWDVDVDVCDLEGWWDLVMMLYIDM